jgi:hypothetical protein
MKSFTTASKSLALALLGGSLLTIAAPQAKADVAEAADKAYQMAMKYSGMGYYMTPSKEGHGGFGVTYEFEVPVNRGLDYVFIVSGDHYCQDIEVWIEAEETGNTIVKDTRKVQNGLAGVRWRSDYNGSVNVVVNFARVTSRCGWCALVGRRGTVSAPYEGTLTTPAGGAQKLESGVPKPSDTDATAK